MFARAKDLRDAYVDVLSRVGDHLLSPVTLEACVMGASELPDTKHLAKAWWMLAQRNANNVHAGNETDFEAAWDEMGPDPDEG